MHPSPTTPSPAQRPSGRTRVPAVRDTGPSQCVPSVKQALVSGLDGTSRFGRAETWVSGGTRAPRRLVPEPAAAHERIGIPFAFTLCTAHQSVRGGLGPLASWRTQTRSIHISPPKPYWRHTRWPGSHPLTKICVSASRSTCTLTTVNSGFGQQNPRGGPACPGNSMTRPERGGARVLPGAAIA